MAFLDILKGVVDKVDGAVAGTIMAKDGIAIENYVKEGAYDIDSVGVEYARILAETRHASSMLKLGEVEELSISAEGSTVIMRLINQDYFMAIVVDPHGNLGKARYYLKRGAVMALKEF